MCATLFRKLAICDVTGALKQVSLSIEIDSCFIHTLISVFDLWRVFKTFKTGIESPVQFHDGCLYFFSHIVLRLAAKVKRGLIFLNLTIWFEGCWLHIVFVAKRGIWLKKENVSVTQQATFKRLLIRNLRETAQLVDTSIMMLHARSHRRAAASYMVSKTSRLCLVTVRARAAHATLSGTWCFVCSVLTSARF